MHDCNTVEFSLTRGMREATQQRQRLARVVLLLGAVHAGIFQPPEGRFDRRKACRAAKTTLQNSGARPASRRGTERKPMLILFQELIAAISIVSLTCSGSLNFGWGPPGD